MKRIIKNYKTITQEQLKLISTSFPDGFDSEELLTITNTEGKYIRCLEIKTDEVIYLFKIDDGMIEVLDEHFEGDADFGELADSEEEFED